MLQRLQSESVQINTFCSENTENDSHLIIMTYNYTDAI